MKKLFGFVILAIALTASASAQMTGASSGGMDAMKYYVGSWSCMAGNVGEKPVPATTTYTMEPGMLRQIVNVPPTGKMKEPYIGSASVVWDSKKHEYIQSWLGNGADASVSTTKALTGNTEQWVEVYDSSGKLGRTKIVRTSNDRMDWDSYETMSSQKPYFKGYCTRSASSS